MYKINEKMNQIQQNTMASVHAFNKKAIENSHNIAQTHLDATKELITKRYQRIMEFTNQKNSKDLMHVFTTQGLDQAFKDLIIYQTTLTFSLRKNQQEIIEKANSSFADAKKHLQELVDEAISKAPPGSEVLTASFKIVFEASLYGYDQIRSKIHDTFALTGKTVETTMALSTQEISKSARNISIKNSPD